ncbi:MAG: hypothetical protein JWM10_4698 [Myxococcaceae bacterium]|nr:hypothetical protein [Myxococcaceae bacterium]
MKARLAAAAVALLAPSAAWSQPAAAPPTAAGNTGLSVRPGVEVFAQYALRSAEQPDSSTAWSHAFEVPRVHAALTGEFDDARARVVLEAIGPAAGGAVVGASADAFSLRVREAFAGWSPGRVLRVQLGVVPTLTIPEIEGTWRFRVLSPTALERRGLGAPADLGATVRCVLPGSFGWVGVGAFNGEGYAGRDLDRGNNVEVAASVHPIPLRAWSPLAVFASFTLGTSGVSGTRADRLTAGLLWQDRSVRACVVGTAAWGVGSDGSRVSYLVETFARVEPVERLLLGLRYAFQQRDDRVASEVSHELLGSVGYRVVEPLEVFAAAGRSFDGATLPGAEGWDLRIATRGVY